MSGTESISNPFNDAMSLCAGPRDKHGNPDGARFDLAKDGAFAGLQVAVLQLYNGEGFDFGLPGAALAEKGFSVRRMTTPPPSHELRSILAASCQLWVISDSTAHLSEDHVTAIEEFFTSGKGVYIWGDNTPFQVDANMLAGRLLSASMSGDVPGEQIVHQQQTDGRRGMVAAHPICMGLESLYEGHTIATIGACAALEPVVYGSADNLVVASYDHDGRRALLDGGFTRLYRQWDTAGTGRYVKNAAAWLVNYERFGATLRMGARRQ